MAHFAQIENGVVTQVIVVNNDVLRDEDGVEQEERGVEFCRSLFGGEWKQTSYSGSVRGVFAGVGFRYDAETDKFIAPKE